MLWENKSLGTHAFDSRHCDVYAFLIKSDIIKLINSTWGLIRFNYGWQLYARRIVIQRGNEISFLIIAVLNTELKNISEVFRASLVAQWLGVRLPMQGTRVRALVREDPTCCRAARLVRHNC